MNLVIDSSVAIKWFVRESLHEEAKRFLGGANDLHAPDLLIVELANVAWKKARRKEITSRQAEEIAVACLDGIPTLHGSVGLIDRAVQISLTLDHPVYDCIYLACAEALNGVVITADARFQKIVQSAEFDSLVKVLHEISQDEPFLRISAKKLFELIKLSKIMLATKRNVYNAIRSKNSSLSVNTKELQPFFDSPSLQSIRKYFKSLKEEEQADFLALGWLGQGYSGTDWEPIRERAGKSISGYANNDYIYPISLTVYLERGVKLLQKMAGGQDERSP